MSQAYASTAATNPLRRLGLRLWQDPDSRSTSIGLAAVVVFHLLLFLLAPIFLRSEHLPSAPRPPSTARDFNIELTPEMFAKPPLPKPKDPSKFVETNPEAPENTPDKTNNFAAQNQQAAQEKPNPDGKSDRAATQGKKDMESNQIVSGRLTQPTERAEPEPPAPQPAEVTPMVNPRMQQNPLSGAEKFEGTNETGIGSSIAKRLENAKSVSEKVEGVKEAKELDGAPTMPVQQPAIDPRRPRARPMVVKQQQVRPAILADNPVGTRNMGISGIDARWSNYGMYLQKMVDAVQIQWERLILSMPAMPASGSTVSVRFVINDEGKIAQIKNVETVASETASRACVSAITDRAPYGVWTDDMKAMLGTQQEMTFTFFYQ